MAQDEAQGNRDAALAVVASSSAEDCDRLRGVLDAGGLRARTVTTAASLLDDVLTHRPDLLLVDLDIALDYADALSDVVDRHPQLAGLPVILLLPDGGVAQLPDGLAPYVSDVVFRPVAAEEVLHRSRSAMARRRRHQAQRASSARLREDMRRISARIRSTNDPVAMVDQFLPHLGRSLGADRVTLQMFDDDRVAARSSTWNRGPGTESTGSTASTQSTASTGSTGSTDDTDGAHGAHGAPATHDGHAGAGRAADVAGPRRSDQESAFALALGLWEDTATASFSAGPAATPRPGDIPAPDWLLRGSREHTAPGPPAARTADRTLHGVVAALGEGDTPFGLLWVVRAETPLVWTGVEAALTQHVLGNLAHGLIQAQLISRQQEAVRKLRALNQAKSDFVGTVNHELRTPLASIAGYLEMIIDGVGGELPTEAQTMLQAVERNTTRLSHLIENISALNAREADASEHGPVDIVHLVSELTSRLVLEAANGGVTLECVLPETSVTVPGNRDQLSEALTVVLSNALKFTQEEGSVIVRLLDERDHGRAVVTVQDTGIGIPADDLPRLFDSFHRASNATQALPGAGVGLSLAKRTLEDHHGSITIESQLGVGTSVVVTLPLLSHAAVG